MIHIIQYTKRNTVFSCLVLSLKDDTIFFIFVAASPACRVPQPFFRISYITIIFVFYICPCTVHFIVACAWYLKNEGKKYRLKRIPIRVLGDEHCSVSLSLFARSTTCWHALLWNCIPNFFSSLFLVMCLHVSRLCHQSAVCVHVCVSQLNIYPGLPGMKLVPIISSLYLNIHCTWTPSACVCNAWWWLLNDSNAIEKCASCFCA